MKLKIVKDNNPKIRKKSEDVALPLSSEDQDLLDSMFNYLVRSQDEEYATKHNIRAGVGLAAIQVGAPKRMFVIYYQNGDRLVQYKLVNPKIIETSLKKVALQDGEGCLSVDKDHKGYVHRHYKIVMKAYDDLQKKDIIITATGYDAIVLQHEYDHLSGILFYDHIVYDAPFVQLPNEELI